MHRFLAIVVFIVFIPCAVRGQQAAPATETAAAEQPAEVPPVGLMPGDTLSAYFIDFPEAPKIDLTVSPAGNIFIPYVGLVKVQGMMPDEAQEAVIAALEAKQVVRSPTVALTVVTARNLSVMIIGSVLLPHQVPLYAPAPLSYVLAQAGGMSPSASYHVLIAHRDGSAPEDVELDRSGANPRGLNAVVKPGDVVSVVQAGSFFALGEFNHPGIYAMTGANHLTLTQAITMASGPDLQAMLSKARILRNVNGHREEIMFDFAKLHDGKIADPLIQADDIVYFPRSTLKVIANSWINSSLYALSLVDVVKSY
ncbi:MAG: polysaccharide biosynthesis/export family protein [Terracidiphilus sp.]